MPVNMDRLTNYLGSIMKEQGLPEPEKMKTVPFVTISRQAGAGGHSLSEALLKAIDAEKSVPGFRDWHSFDQEICARVLDDPKLNVSFNSLLTEEYHNQISDYIMQLVARTSSQYAVYKKIFRMIRTLALCGRSIFVGRGAVCYTRDIPGGIHVRLVAPEPVRIKRLERRFGLTEAKARQMAKPQDASRKKLVMDFFRRDIDDPSLYDVVWNTDRVEMEDIASWIMSMIQKNMREAEHADTLATSL